MSHNSELKNKIAYILVKILLTMQNVFETFHYFLSLELQRLTPLFAVSFAIVLHENSGYHISRMLVTDSDLMRFLPLGGTPFCFSLFSGNKITFCFCLCCHHSSNLLNPCRV